MKLRSQPSDEMPHRAVSSTPCSSISLRRSPRFLPRNRSLETPASKSPRPNPEKIIRAKHQLEEKPKKSEKFEGRSRRLGDSGAGLRRSPRLSIGLKSTPQCGEKGEAKRRSCRQTAGVKEIGGCVEKREVRTCCCVLGLAAAVDKKGAGEADNRTRTAKRKREEEASGIGHGWTKEQEAALQRAYFAAKPTPSFWKKVSRLVPGKSAQECFDKVNSDLSTPQPRTRARAPKRGTSQTEPSPLSASKILEPLKPIKKTSTRNRTKSHVLQRTVRQLLQKHYQSDQTIGADLFSILEPNVDASCMFSTPETAGKKQGFVHSFRERSSSSSKKPLSRFHSSGGIGKILISPPVLKPVKNRALHEKYLDQLHSRRARRNSNSMVNKSEGGLKIDAVRAAKEALVSGVNDAINRLRDLRDSPGSDSRGLDDEYCNDEDDYDDADNVC